MAGSLGAELPDGFTLDPPSQDNTPPQLPEAAPPPQVGEQQQYGAELPSGYDLDKSNDPRNPYSDTSSSGSALKKGFDTAVESVGEGGKKIAEAVTHPDVLPTSVPRIIAGALGIASWPINAAGKVIEETVPGIKEAEAQDVNRPAWSPSLETPASVLGTLPFLRMAPGGLRPRTSGVTTGDIDPAVDLAAKAANPPGAEEAPPPPPPAQTQPPPVPGSIVGSPAGTGEVPLGQKVGEVQAPGAQQAIQTSQARAPTPLKDLPFAEDAEALQGGHEEITPRQPTYGPELPKGYTLDPARETLGGEEGVAPPNLPDRETAPEKIGAEGVGGQNENALPAATAAEDEAIARMKPPPPGEPHSLGAQAGGQSELPEAPPPLFSGTTRTGPEETAARFQEENRVEKLNRAAEANDIMDKLKDATGRGPWNAIKAMLGFNEGNMSALHEAVESGDFSKLTPRQKEIWEKSGLGDLHDEAHDWFQKEIDAGRMVDRGQTTGAPRMTEKQWLEQTGQANREDPVGGDVGKRNLGTEYQFEEPPTYRMRDGQGNTQIVTDTPHGFKIWDKGEAQDVVNPTEMSIGAKVEHDGKTWTVEKPTMDEVEKNVKDKDGDFVKYIRSPITAIDTVMKQRDLTRNMRALDLIKADPAFDGMRVNTKEAADTKGFVETKIPQLRGMYFDPEIAAQLNSFHTPGFDADLGTAGKAIAGINRFLTSSMFWNPVPHTLNTAAHWFVARGADWFIPTRYPDFFASSRDALREVIGNGPAYREYLRDGAPFMFPSVNAGRMTNLIGKLGEVAIEQDPKSWNAIAQQFGLGTGRDLVKLWYQGARNVLWQSGDILAMQRIMELERRGLDRNDAIQDTRNHMPDYNIPYKVMGQTWLSQLMQDPRNLLSVFNRYHMGVFKSLAKIAHDTVSPTATHDDRMKAIGNALALATLAYVVKPGLDAGWQAVTGNKDAEANPRGPMAPLTAAKDFFTGKKTMSQAMSGVATMSPFFKAATELFTGHDAFTGKNITEPMSPFHHQLAQAIGHAADYVAPVKTFSGSLMPGNKGSLGHELAAQVGDFKNPTPGQKESRRKGLEITKKAAQAREKKPQNLLEYGVKKLGYAEGGAVLPDGYTLDEPPSQTGMDKNEATRLGNLNADFPSADMSKIKDPPSTNIEDRRETRDSLLGTAGMYAQRFARNTGITKDYSYNSRDKLTRELSPSLADRLQKQGYAGGGAVATSKQRSLRRA